MCAGQFSRRRPQRLRNRHAAGVRTPPPRETQVNLPHVWGITGISLAIVCPPRPVGQWTDVSNFRQLKSRTLAERTLSFGCATSTVSAGAEHALSSAKGQVLRVTASTRVRSQPSTLSRSTDNSGFRQITPSSRERVPITEAGECVTPATCHGHPARAGAWPGWPWHASASSH